MSFDHSEIRGKIIAKYGSINRYAEVKSIPKDRIYRMLCRNLTDDEMFMLSTDLGIKTEDFPVYFFTPEHCKTQCT